MSDAIKLVPHYNESSKACFVDAAYYTPIMDATAGHLTAPLKFGQAIDLISLSNSVLLLSCGIADMTDSIDPNVSINSVFYLLEDEVKEFKLFNEFGQPMPYASLGMSRNSYSQLDVNLSFVVCQDDPRGETTFDVTGKLDLQTGALTVHCNSRNPAFMPLGFTINANRANANRRPQESATAISSIALPLAASIGTLGHSSGLVRVPEDSANSNGLTIPFKPSDEVLSRVSIHDLLAHIQRRLEVVQNTDRATEDNSYVRAFVTDAQKYNITE